MKKEFSVYSQYCPSHNVLVGISDKWSILIISLLSKKIYRFGELRRKIGGISPKILAQALQKLQRYNLVARDSSPIIVMKVTKVEYSLTPLGQELGAILNRLTKWTEINMEKIVQAEQN